MYALPIKIYSHFLKVAMTVHRSVCYSCPSPLLFVPLGGARGAFFNVLLFHF